LLNTTVSGAKGEYAISSGFYEENIKLINSTVSGNSGGGISVFRGGLDLINSTLSDNTGSGGIVLEYADAKIVNSTITGNTSNRYGGGLLVDDKGSATIENSTFSGNAARFGGGGIEVAYNARVSLSHTTVTGNSGPTGGGIDVGESYDANYLYIEHSIVSGNLGARGREINVGRERYAYVRAGAFNVFGFSGDSGVEGFTPEATDIVPTQPRDGVVNPTLANNGGLTLTHTLVKGSPAIDAVNDGTCPPPAVDQRGFARPQDGDGDGGPACDIGSFELKLGQFRVPKCNGLNATIVGTDAPGNHTRHRQARCHSGCGR
jgi:hypothetical protein